MSIVKCEPLSHRQIPVFSEYISKQFYIYSCSCFLSYSTVYYSFYPKISAILEFGEEINVSEKLHKYP
jgi:hypothetical protein